ncbi:MAG: hypothetical protein KC643_09825 [Nitrospira sp.]|nr:hypothetical protein [Nitrospira sp.]
MVFTGCIGFVAGILKSLFFDPFLGLGQIRNAPDIDGIDAEKTRGRDIHSRKAWKKMPLSLLSAVGGSVSSIIIRNGFMPDGRGRMGREG